MLDLLSREFCTGCPLELLYADDLMLSDVSIEKLLVKLKTRKEGHAVGHRENKDYDVCHLSGPAEEIWKGSLRRLSDSRK